MLEDTRCCCLDHYLSGQTEHFMDKFDLALSTRFDVVDVGVLDGSDGLCCSSRVRGRLPPIPNRLVIPVL